MRTRRLYMGDVVRIAGSSAKAKRDHNKMCADRVVGVPGQPGTAESDADPRNPNVRPGETSA
jgi:hypothetical protein